jgi:hypothetical protein
MGYYDGGEDIIYELNITSATIVNLRLTSSTTYTGIGVFETCPPGSIALAANGTSATGAEITCLPLDPGTYYVMVDTYASPDCIPDFDLVIFDTTCVIEPPPPNDVCAGAITVYGGSGTPYVNGPFTCVSATDGAAVPSGCGSSMFNDTWYYYETTCGNAGGPYGTLIVTTEGTSLDGGLSEDTKLALYLGLPDCSDLYFIACNDDLSYPSYVWSSLTITGIEPGLPIYLQVATYYVDEEGDIYVNIDCQDPQPPPCNDACDALTTTPCSGYEAGIPTLTESAPLTFSSTFAGATDAGCPDLGNSVWDAFVLDTCMNVIIAYCGTTPSINTVSIVLEDDCPCNFDPVTYDGLIFYDAISWTACGDGNPMVLWMELQPGTYYYPQFQDPVDANWDYTITIQGEICYPYCTPATNANYEYIERVQFGTIDNTTGATSGGFANYTEDFSTLVYAGASYPLTVTIGAAYSTDIVGAWFDWNLDFVFDVVTEFVALSGNPVATAMIDVPVTAVEGESTMRVQMTDGSLGTLDPCGETGYGEYEDYRVIVEALPCGDVNVDDAIDGADVTYLIDFYFNSGAAPLPILENGDANGDCCVGLADIIFLAEYVYRAGAEPICLPCR